MVRIVKESLVWDGPHGELIMPDEEVARKLAMLIEGQCHAGPTAAAERFGFSRQRYFQLLAAVRTDGLEALRSEARPQDALAARPMWWPRLFGIAFSIRGLGAVIAQKMRHERLSDQHAASTDDHRVWPSKKLFVKPTGRRPSKRTARKVPCALAQAMRAAANAPFANFSRQGFGLHVGLFLLPLTSLGLLGFDSRGWTGGERFGARARLALQLVTRPRVTRSASAARSARRALAWPMACRSATDARSIDAGGPRGR
jgi:hypothetical protein